MSAVTYPLRHTSFRLLLVLQKEEDKVHLISQRLRTMYQARVATTMMPMGTRPKSQMENGTMLDTAANNPISPFENAR